MQDTKTGLLNAVMLMANYIGIISQSNQRRETKVLKSPQQSRCNMMDAGQYSINESHNPKSRLLHIPFVILARLTGRSYDYTVYIDC